MVDAKAGTALSSSSSSSSSSPSSGFPPEDVLEAVVPRGRGVQRAERRLPHRAWNPFYVSHTESGIRLGVSIRFQKPVIVMVHGGTLSRTVRTHSKIREGVIEAAAPRGRGVQRAESGLPHTAWNPIWHKHYVLRSLCHHMYGSRRYTVESRKGPVNIIIIIRIPDIICPRSTTRDTENEMRRT
jgi:hypothetical protein